MESNELNTDMTKKIDKYYLNFSQKKHIDRVKSAGQLSIIFSKYLITRKETLVQNCSEFK